MSNLDGRAAWILLTVLLLTAVIGFEQGLVKALAAARDATPATAAQSDREPVPSAQPLSSAPLDEAQVRQIARQEAEAAISRSKPKKRAPVEDNADSPDAAPVASPPPLAIPPVQTAPAAPGV